MKESSGLDHFVIAWSILGSIEKSSLQNFRERQGKTQIIILTCSNDAVKRAYHPAKWHDSARLQEADILKSFSSLVALGSKQ
jgi:hypothetical protein